MKNIRRRYVYILSLFVVLILISGCSPKAEVKDNTATTSKKVNVVSTVHDYSIRNIKIAHYGQTGILVFPKYAISSTNEDHEIFKLGLYINEELFFSYSSSNFDRKQEKSILKDSVENIVYGFDVSDVNFENNPSVIVLVSISLKSTNGEIQEQFVFPWDDLRD